MKIKRFLLSLVKNLEMISRQKLKIGNVVSLKIDEVRITGMITDVCYIREIFTIIGSLGMKDYCTETLIDKNIRVISCCQNMLQ